MTNAIGQEAFVAHDMHIFHRAMNARRQKFFAQAGQGRRSVSAKQIRRDGEIELIDQAEIEH